MNYFLVLLNQHSEEETSSNPYDSHVLMLEQLLKTITGEFAGVVKVKNDDGKTVIRDKNTGEFFTRLRRGYIWQSLGYHTTQTAFLVTTSATKAVVTDSALLAFQSSVCAISFDATKLKIEYNSSDDRPIYDDMYA